MLPSERALRESKDGKGLHNSEVTKKTPPRQLPNRPRMNVDVESILKDELVEIFAVDRTKLLTAEQQKVIWKKEEKIRDSGRRLATALEKQHEDEERQKRAEMEELYANVTKEKIKARRKTIQDKKLAEFEANKQRILDSNLELTEEEKRVSLVRDDAQEILGEGDDISKNERKTRNKFGVPFDPNNELPGEYGDGEWEDAEGYGYSSKFPYQKNEKIIHKGSATLPDYVPPESSGSDDHEKSHNKHRNTAVADGGSQEEGEAGESQLGPGVNLTTDNLTGLESGLFHVDKAATSLALLLGKIVSHQPLTPRVPEKAFAYQYIGDDEMSVDVETDLLQTPSNDRDRAPMADKSTQVWAKDIFDAMAALKKSLAEAEAARKEKEKLEQDEIELERKASKRRDAMVLTRPAGYKELELSNPVEESGITFEQQTQVKDYEIDQEYAMERGIVLSADNILWPTVGDFAIETASKRIEDYIEKCWNLDAKWMSFIQPVETISDEYRKRFVFEVKFSIPTPLNPIPLATASVFFIFELSHYAPKEDFVKVHYVVEGNRFVHTPGTLPFQDKWLWSVLSDKIRLQRSVNF